MKKKPTEGHIERTETNIHSTDLYDVEIYYICMIMVYFLVLFEQSDVIVRKWRLTEFSTNSICN